MKRRSLLLAPLAGLFVPSVSAAPVPWSARWLKGGFDGTQWWGGLAITLAPGWKTYWRVPGAGGIAPQITVTGSNLKSSAIHHPLPQRFESEAGETIGYGDKVVFPIALTPENPLLPVAATFSAFIGVCEVVCIPAQSDGAVRFDPSRSEAPDQKDISFWQRLVPKPSTDGPIMAVIAKDRDDGPYLQLDTKQRLEDLFIEADAKYYFGKPGFMRGLALVPVKGAKTAAELKGLALRMTLDTGSWPLEQHLTVG